MKNIPFITLVLFIVALSSACGPNALPPPTVAVAPTATVASPTTAATNPPTVTVAPTTAPTRPPSPTVVKIAPTTSISETLGAAATKLETLNTYHGEFRSNFGGPSNWKGDVRVPDSHYIFSGAFVQNAEIIRVEGKSYVKSPATEEWLLIPDSEMYKYEAISARGAIRELLGDVGAFQQSGTETLDGLQCELYTQDKRAVAATFYGFLTSIPLSGDASPYFDLAELQAWLCADGHIHQIHMKVKLKPQAGQPEPQQVEFFAHIYDLDADIQIVAPTNVKAFPTRTLTPTPVREPTPTPVSAEAAPKVLAETNTWDVVLSDAFDIPANDWTVDSYTTEDKKANVTKKIADGKYTWTIHANEPLMNHDFPQVPTKFQHGAIAVEARWVSGARDCRYGIEVHGYFVADNANFLVRPDGAWLISANSGFLEGNHLASGNVPPRQAGQPYRLLVIQRGKTLLFFINDELVTTITRRGEAANPGLAMQFDAPNQDCVVEFDNFEVRIPPPPPATANGRVIVSGFDAANAAQFPVGAYDQPPLADKREIVNDKYRWEILAPRDEIERFAIPKMDAVTDFTASVTIKNVQGPDRAYAGIAFRHTDADNFYKFYIGNYGSFTISKTSKDRYSALAGGSNAIKKGEPNRLKIVAIGSQLSFYINNVLVAQLDDSTLTQGDVGLVAMVYEPGATGIYEFSNFEVRAP